MSGLNEVLLIYSWSFTFVTTTFQDLKTGLWGTYSQDSAMTRAAVGGCEGFKEDWKNVTEKDAAAFLLALNEGLIEHRERGLYEAPR